MQRSVLYRIKKWDKVGLPYPTNVFMPILGYNSSRIALYVAESSPILKLSYWYFSYPV